MTQLEFTDRYGGNYPDPETVCKGPCEGMGVYPVRHDIHVACREDCDGWQFVKCPDCRGTGKR